MDFLTFFLSVSDGLINWPVEVTRTLQALAVNNAMCKIFDGANTAIIRLQLDNIQHNGGVTRKFVACEDLGKCVDVCSGVDNGLSGSAGGLAAPLNAVVASRSPPVLSTRTLAIHPLSDWTAEYWKFALQLKMFSSANEVAEMEVLVEYTYEITQANHKELSELLQTKESIKLMDDEALFAYNSSINDSEFTLRMDELHEKMLDTDFDIDNLLMIALPTPGKFERNWGRMAWNKFVVYVFTNQNT